MTKEQQDIIDAVMLTDFSELLNTKFRVGDCMPVGLSDLIQAKGALKRREFPGERAVRTARRCALASERLNFEAAEKALEEWRAARDKK